MNKNTKLFKYGVFVAAVLVLIVIGGIRWVISQSPSGTQVGDDLSVGGNIILGRDMIDGSTLNKLYDNTAGQIPLGRLAPGLVD